MWIRNQYLAGIEIEVGYLTGIEIEIECLTGFDIEVGGRYCDQMLGVSTGS